MDKKVKEVYYYMFLNIIEYLTSGKNLDNIDLIIRFKVADTTKVISR